ncbi:MAG: hypothetical protein A2Y00_08460 [Omnitrophica WOR_2 bacterium GWF2_43_52]|nr:MAG: hypothetical protein A2062_03865 [Omnitrophica WOR_2 bacterium GWA2_44_7]OGX21131.1 MAG: hypothetical protein A2Y00_08460 [Omnitrophica WOR_2 bacterium GWF2_43_52]OGX55142.1 MAG: hypothetical protein A2460_10010 [Omnitrophica WOR_2 bacterium RIFOXYC2_FULL_43_9]HAH19931.1 hypothetical protein [Candidatus Omnitrophota bacterium]HBG62920.1 hypothetical protein [Candidatus Omnitrophota bacterium]
MLILGVFFGILIASMVMWWIWNTGKRSVQALSIASLAKRDLLEVIGTRLQYAQESNAKIAASVEMESALYEVTKELSKPLEEEDILNTFREKITALFNLSEAEFVESPDASGKSVFRISANQKTYYFAVRDSVSVNRVKMMVMVNQLELFLKRAELYREIQELSITDSLTGVYVRRYFMERFKEEQVRAKQNNLALSFLIIDVDNFKTYNDTYGHITGDFILREIGRILSGSLRQIDMCARYGGEEFCIMLPETIKEKAYLVAERIRLNMEKARISAFHERFNCTISIGVSSYPEDAEQISRLIDKADKALYIAKAKGRNRVCAFGIKC